MCFLELEMHDVDNVKMPGTAVAEPAPVRTYINREGEATLARVAQEQAEYENKNRQNTKEKEKEKDLF